MRLTDERLQEIDNCIVRYPGHDVALGREEFRSLLDEVRESRKVVEVGKENFSFHFNDACDSYICPSCQADVILKHNLIAHFCFHYCPNCGVKLAWKEA